MNEDLDAESAATFKLLDRLAETPENERWRRIGEINIFSPRERARTALYVKLTDAGWPGWAAAMRLNWKFLTGFMVVMIIETVLVTILANHVRAIKDESNQYKRERDACLSTPK